MGDHDGQPAGPGPLPPGADPAGLEALALDLAVQAARFVHDERPDRVSVSATKTTELDVVTAMDTGSERLLRDRLGGERPDDGVLGEEEGGLVTGTSGLTWVLDPIDGTVNYLYDLPAYAVSVAVVAGDPTVPGGWRPVAGAVANPRVGEVFHAHEGGGAWVRALSTGPDAALGPARPVHVTAADELDRALVGTGFGYAVARRTEQGRVAAEVLLRVRDLRRMGSAALDLCSVAAGRLDAYYERGLQPWDLAAGVLIVTEAGGTVTGLHGPAGEDMVVAGPRPVQVALHDLLAELLGEERRS